MDKGNINKYLRTCSNLRLKHLAKLINSMYSIKTIVIPEVHRSLLINLKNNQIKWIKTTYCKVEILGVIGSATILRKDFKRAKLMATIDAILNSDSIIAERIYKVLVLEMTKEEHKKKN